MSSRVVVSLGAMCAAVVSFVNPAPAAVLVQLKLDHALISGPPAVDRWATYATLGEFRDFQLTSASGSVSTRGSAKNQHISGHGPFATYDDFETEAAKTWRLTLNGATPAETSVYDLSFNFSAFGEANVGRAEVLSPLADATSGGPQHTFTWTKPTVTPSQLFTSVQQYDVKNGLYKTQSYWGNAAPTSWSLADLDPGRYQFRLEFQSFPLPIPITATRISGPDAGPFTASIAWNQQSAAWFTVVPEPAGTTLILGGLLAATTTRRRRAC